MRGTFFLFSSIILLAFSIQGEQLLSSVEDGVKYFEADTTAHKMRLPVRIHELLNDPRFYEALPEYKELEKYKEEVVRLAFEHDSSKIFLSRDSETIRIAAQMNGRYWRDFPDSDPLKNQAKNAFAELTRIDNSHEGESAKRLFKDNEKARKLAQEIVKITDWDDVPKMRNAEFTRTSKHAHKLDPVSVWLEKPEIKQTLSPDEFRRTSKLAKVLERPEFAYSQNVKYYTTERVLGKKFETLARSFFSAKYPSSKFEILAMSKSFNQTVAGSSSVSKAVVGKVISKSLAAGTVISQSYQYAKNPDKNIPENFLKGLFFMSGGKPQCHGYYCHLLIAKCESEQQVAKGKSDWNKCVQYFYTMSLDQQNRFLTDKDLKDSLQDVGPLVQDISCQSKSTNNISLSFKYRPGMGYGYQQQDQTIQYRSDGSVANVEIEPNIHNQFVTRIHFDGTSQPQNVQECLTKTDCKNIEASKVQKFGIKSPSAKRLMSFMSLQSENIRNCCKNKECISYFEKKIQPSSDSALASILANK